MPWYTKLERPSAFEGIAFALFQRRLKKGTVVVAGQFNGYRVVATKFLRTAGRDFSIPVVV